MVLWTFALYLVVLVLIGFAARRHTKDLDDFVLADRKVGVWATALSYEVTAYSGWLMLGFPGKAFSRGLGAVWVGVACVVGDVFNWLLISRRLREESERLKALTVPEYLDRKFHRDGSHSVRIAASLALLVFMFLYMWSQVVAAGKAVATAAEVSYPGAVLIATGVILIYTFQGGYRAVVWVDVFQGVMMMLALVVLPIVCLVRLGGLNGLQSALARASAEAAEATASGSQELAGSLHLGELFAGLSGMVMFRFLFEDAGVGAGYLGQPHIGTRFMSIEHPRHLRPAFLISVVFAAVVCSGAVGVGLVAHGWFRFTPETIDVGAAAGPAVRQFLADAEQVLPRLVIAVFPAWLAGLVVSTIMADVVSSAAGYLMSAASSGVEDVYFRLFRRSAGRRELLLAARAITVALGLGAGLLALSTDPTDKKSAVYYLVLYAWGGLAGAFSAPVVMAIYYRPMTRAGCLAGIIVGSVTSLVWHNVPALAEQAYEVIPAIGLSALSIVLVSAVTRTRTDPSLAANAGAD